MNVTDERLPIGIKLLSAFFAFGATICVITIVALFFSGGALESIWRLNPDAHVAFQQIGRLSILLMFVVGSACALSSSGLTMRAQWGDRLYLGILAFSLVGDLLNAFVRHDFRT